MLSIQEAWFQCLGTQAPWVPQNERKKCEQVNEGVVAMVMTIARYTLIESRDIFPLHFLMLTEPTYRL